jgi:pimeloyl-ACP methyl ester carboxylesterase
MPFEPWIQQQSLELVDGRRLAWEDAGDPAGAPVLYCHGAPGCRLQRRVFISDDDLRGTGVRMITPDRPGCGRSDFQPGRRIWNWPQDVAALVDHLGLDRFAVLGFSGGTPYALALAASSLPVAALGIVSGDAPPGQVPGVPTGLPEMADRRPRLTELALRATRFAAQVAPDFTADRGTAMLTDADRAVVRDPIIRRRFVEMLIDAIGRQPCGVLLDLQLAHRPWEVRPPRTPVPIQIRHGEADADSPPSIGRYLADALPSAELRTFPGEGHVSVFVHHAVEVLTDLRAAAEGPDGA